MHFTNWLIENKAVSGKDWFYNQKTNQMEQVPVVFIRFGNLPPGNSMNHFINQYEKGVSVYAAYYDRPTKKFILQSGGEQLLSTQDEITTTRPAYLVTGIPVDGEVGGDDETLLHRDSIKIIRRLKPEEITTEQDPDIDILGNDMDFTPKVKFSDHNNLQEVRRKVFKFFKNLNFPENSNGIIGYLNNLQTHYFYLNIDPITYDFLMLVDRNLKSILGKVIVDTYSPYRPPKEKIHVMFKVKNGILTI